MLVKVYKSYRDIVAICDAEILGKKFEEDIFQLDLKENFYNGRKISKEELIKLLKEYSKEDATFNIVGKKSVECAIESEIIDRKSVKKIKGVPFALVLL